jgi:hypothetical protein
MIDRFGVLLLDQTELILRIYEIHGGNWRLAYYTSKNITATPYSNDQRTGLTAAIADIFSSRDTDHIAEWKVCARETPQQLSEEIRTLTGFSVEYLSPEREQELLCKGLFTELW